MSVILYAMVERGEQLLGLDEQQVRAPLRKCDYYESIPPDGLHPLLLSKLANVLARVHSLILERPWRLGENPLVQKCKYCTHLQTGQEVRTKEPEPHSSP